MGKENGWSISETQDAVSSREQKKKPLAKQFFAFLSKYDCVCGSKLAQERVKRVYKFLSVHYTYRTSYPTYV